MTRTLSLLTVFALVSTALAVAPALSADAPESCRPGNVFQNEDVRIWFHGSKGFVKVFDTNGTDDEGTHYQYKTIAVQERVVNGSAVHAWMNLERAYPQSSTCTVEETNEWVNMTITITDRVQPGAGGEGPTLGDATVTFSYNFNKTANGAKFDLQVDSWPWQQPDTELAYTFDVHVAGGSIESAENGVGFRDSNNMSQGYITWAANATAHYDDGHNETALVDSDTAIDGDTARIDLRFTNVTAGYESLVYDPWIGVGEYIIVGGILVGLAPIEEILPRGVMSLLRSLF